MTSKTMIIDAVDPKGSSMKGRFIPTKESSYEEEDMDVFDMLGIDKV